MRRWSLLLALVPSIAAGQSSTSIRGTVYDSLMHAPLWGADVWLRGREQRALTDSGGRFRIDSVAPGRYTLLVAHPGLDSAGLFTLAIPVTVAAGDSLPVRVATPSLATLWRRRCGQDLMFRSDSGLIFGVVQDAKTQDHLAGAGVLLQWLRIVQSDPTTVHTQPRDMTVHTDSTGAYYACGVARDMKIGLRGYAQRDSSGLVDVTLGPRGVGRGDLSIALAPSRTPAVLRGQATTPENIPVYSGRVTVREGTSTVIDADGGFIIRNVTPGTQWVTVQAIGRSPAGQAVEFRPGDTTWLNVTLYAPAVTLAPVRVLGQPSRQLADFEERRRSGSGLGYFRGEEEIAGAGSVRAVLTTLPSVQLVRGSGNTDYMALLPNPSINGSGAPGGWCVAVLYVDGVQSEWEQVQSLKPKDLVGVEVYVRASEAPLQYQHLGNPCGVVLFWTTYLRLR